MSLLQTTLIAKAAYDNGFENTSTTQRQVQLSSALHGTRLVAWYEAGAFRLELAQASGALHAALAQEFAAQQQGKIFACLSELELHQFLRRTAALSRTLPSQAEQSYQADLAAELQRLPEAVRGTEVERLVRQRVGQNSYRRVMLDYWGGACAVTGIAIEPLLRASHAKPWADCASDTERLDVFNGFLLAAHLDALFDRFLISFAADGLILFAAELDIAPLAAIGITPILQLRWMDKRHAPYLQWHRNQLQTSPQRIEGHKLKIQRPKQARQ